jgi:hypothetical protein
MTNILPIVDELGLDIEPIVGALAVNLYTTSAVGVCEDYRGEVIAVQGDKITVKKIIYKPQGLMSPEQITEYQRTDTRAHITPDNDNTYWEALSMNGHSLNSSNGCAPLDRLHFKIDPLVKFMRNGITK